MYRPAPLIQLDGLMLWNWTSTSAIAAQAA
jgi:hypothetical protein